MTNDDAPIVSRVVLSTIASRLGETVRPGRLLAWVLLCATWAPAAVAQTEEQRKTARDLMDQGDERVEQRDYAAALALFRAAHDIMHVPTTGIEVARALVGLGKLVEGREAALEVLHLPQAPDEPKPFTIARVAADQLVRDLTQKFPTLRVVLAPAEASARASLRVDGVSCPQALSVPYALNPGRHRVELSAPGFRPVELQVHLALSERESLRLELQPNSRAPEPPSPTPGELASPPASGVESAPRRSPTWITWTGLGLVGSGLVTGTVAGVIALQRVDAAREHCDGNRCSPEARPDREAAIDAGIVSNVGWTVAGAGAVVVVASWLLQTPASKRAAPPNAQGSQLSLAPTARGALVTFQGTL